MLLACSSNARESTRRLSKHDSVAPVETTLAPVAAPAPAPAVGARVHYAFAKHVAQAELRQREAQLFDFGVDGDAKYTLGGWLGRRTESEHREGRSALRVRASSLRLQLPSDRADVERLSLELRSFAPGTLRLQVNGRALTPVPLAGSAFEAVTVPLPAGAMRAGENTLDLRVEASSAPSEPGFALDFVALSGVRDTTSELAPPPPEQLAARDVLRIPSGIRLSYAFQVPARGFVRARASAAQPAHLTVSLQRDGMPELTLGGIDAGPRAQPLRFDLSTFAGELVRLDLTAENGAVQLDQPELASVEPGAEPRAQLRPIHNVLLYVVDALRADRLAPYDPDTRVTTPGVARFLEHAAVLLRARSQETWTKPSVATLLSSLYPWQHKAITDTSVVPSEVKLLPELLRDRGFFTGAYVANGYVSDRFGFDRGFLTYRNYIAEGRRAVARDIANDVLGWLDARPRDQPFFLYVHAIDTHVPYRPPHDFLSLYDGAPYDGPVDFSRSSELLEQIKLGQLPVTPRDKQHLIALYDGEVSYHDVHFDALMAGLDARGLAGDTLVIVTADHGEEFWDHGSVGHGHSLYDELLHVPLLVRLPGVTTHGAAISEDVGLIDVAPTILEALGDTPPDSWAGHSFLPDLLGETSDAPRATVSGFMETMRAVASGRYKLIQRGLERFVLYDLARDPHETRDVAADHPLAVRYLRAQLGLILGGSDGSRPRQTTTEYTAQTTAIDAATERQLRALGYVGSARH
jgi:arylsulfatase A-like enzyme